MSATTFGVFPSNNLNFNTNFSYQRKRDFEPDGNLIVPGSAYIGYTYNLRSPDWTYEEVSGKLFEHMPCNADIISSEETDDGVFLTALRTILALPDGSAIIMSMMKDKGRVQVMLFDEHSHPVYYSIEKSIPVGPNVLNRGALWVKILEKAYSTHFEDYSKLNQGSADAIIQVLTGARFSGECSLPFQGRTRFSNLKNHVYADKVYRFHELMTLSEDTPKDICNLICKEIFNGQEKLFHAWEKWIEKRGAEWKKIISKTHPIYQEHLVNFFNKHNESSLEIKFLGQILKWIKDNKILPGSLGEYSYDQLEMFQKMQASLKNNAPMFASTAKNCDKKLYPQCGYGVLGLKDNGDNKPKYILLENPSRSSFFGRLFGNEKNTKEVTLEIELNEFCLSFQKLNSFEPISVKAIDERVQQSLAVGLNRRGVILPKR